MQVMERDYSGSGNLRELPPPKPGSVAEVITNAMAWLDANGWCQYVARNNNGETCGHGSIIASVATQVETLPRYEMEYPDISQMMVTLFDPNDIPPVPKLNYVFSKNRDLLYAAEVEAHRFLMQAAEEKGWNEEGGGDILKAILYGTDYDPYKPYKDPFAVFNDDPSTTVEDVKLMMKRAIELADEAEM